MSQPPEIPMWVEPLMYHTPSVSSRPGVLTAVGIISIVVASLSIIANCGSLAQSFMYNMIRAMPASTFTPPVATPYQPQANPGNFTDTQRVIVETTLNRVQHLSPQRRQTLDDLLVQNGDQMFPFAASSFTPTQIAGTISEYGQLPDVGKKFGNDYFVLGSGRIELADDHAVFTPTNGAAVRVYHTPPAVATAVPVVPPTPVINPFASISRSTIILGIVEGVLGLLLAIYLLIIGIMVLRDSLSGRMMHLIYAGLKIPLAIFGGISYGMFYSQMMSSALSTTPGSAPPTGVMTTMFGVMGAVWAGIACIYPISLFIVMNTRKIKEYYSIRPA